MVSELEIMEQSCERLRHALFRLVGADTTEELTEMRAVMVLVSLPTEEKNTMLEAIDALLGEIECMEKGA